MEANKLNKELMFGNYVYFNCFDGSKIVVKLTGVVNNIIYGDSEFGSHWCDIKNVEPIKLTTEILEKIGFERCVSSINRTSTSAVTVCESNQFANKEFGANTRIIDMGIHGFTLITEVFGTTEKNKINHIFYVHQLQQALKLCEIEKEIIL